MVKAIIPGGAYKGTHEGRIAIRFRPSFHLNGFDIHPKYLTTLQHNDGYQYEKGVLHSSPSLKAPGRNATTCMDDAFKILFTEVPA